jgi:hypothetical protein
LYDRKQSCPFCIDGCNFGSLDYGLSVARNRLGAGRSSGPEIKLAARLSPLGRKQSTAAVDNRVGNPSSAAAEARKYWACDRLLKV